MNLADWLRTLGLGQYEAAFRENSVTFDLLPNLTPEDLKDLGITPVGHRRRLLDAISALRADVDLAEDPRAALAEHPTGQPAIVAFNAGNLMPIARTYRQLFPEREIHIAGDNDHGREAEGKPNVCCELSRSIKTATRMTRRWYRWYASCLGSIGLQPVGTVTDALREIPWCSAILLSPPLGSGGALAATVVPSQILATSSRSNGVCRSRPR